MFSSILDEDIGGAELLKLNAHDFDNLKLKIGHKKKIENIIEFYSKCMSNIGDTLDRPTLDDSLNNASFTGSDCNSIFNESVNPSTSNTIPGMYFSQQGPIHRDMRYLLKAKDFMLRDVLNKHPKGPRIINILDKNGPLLGKNQTDFHDIVCKHFVEIARTYYPSPDEKEALAIAIISTFPSLKAKRPCLKGHEHYFDKVTTTGHIEYKLKNMRLSLTPSKKRNTARKRPAREEDHKLDLAIDDEHSVDGAEEMKNWMAYTVASRIHFPQMVEYLESTFQLRRIFMEHMKPSITVALQEYPRFLDYGGDLINKEYCLITRTDGHSKLDEYVPLIMKYNLLYSSKKTENDISDEYLCSLFVLMQALPNSNFVNKNQKGEKRTQMQPKFNYLVKFIKEGEDIEKLTADKKNGILQPYILCVECEKTTKFFLVLDTKLVDVGNSALKAFDILYKSFFVFDVQYPLPLTSFYEFIQVYFYNYNGSLPIRAANESFFSALCNVEINKV